MRVSVERGTARVWKGAREREKKRAAAVVGAAESSGGEGTH